MNSNTELWGERSGKGEKVFICIVFLILTLIGYSLIAVGLTIGFWLITLGKANVLILFPTMLGFVSLFYLITGQRENESGKGND